MRGRVNRHPREPAARKPARRRGRIFRQSGPRPGRHLEVTHMPSRTVTRSVLAVAALLAVLAVAACGSSGSSGTAASPAASPAAPGAAASDAASEVPSAAAGGGDAVTIQNFAFGPQSLSVAVGTTVTWTNADSTSHTATADDGSFDSKSIAAGATFSQTFDTAGTFAYHCSIHPNMTGTIEVK